MGANSSLPCFSILDLVVEWNCVLPSRQPSWLPLSGACHGACQPWRFDQLLRV